MLFHLIQQPYEISISISHSSDKKNQGLEAKVTQQVAELGLKPEPADTAEWQLILTLEALSKQRFHLKQLSRFLIECSS